VRKATYAQLYSLGGQDLDLAERAATQAAERVDRFFQCPRSHRDTSGSAWPRRSVDNSDDDDVDRNPTAERTALWRARTQEARHAPAHALTLPPARLAELRSFAGATGLPAGDHGSHHHSAGTSVLEDRATSH
jgi:hypothetical protein